MPVVPWPHRVHGMIGAYPTAIVSVVRSALKRRVVDGAPHTPADYVSRSPAAQASTSMLNRRLRVSGRFAALIQKARILR